MKGICCVDLFGFGSLFVLNDLLGEFIGVKIVGDVDTDILCRIVDRIIK